MRIHLITLSTLNFYTLHLNTNFIDYKLGFNFILLLHVTFNRFIRVNTNKETSHT
ncbi:hypothetical protein CDIMF43_150142 [Carnobacterium divergens]|nr:hypothetical protein CDIMF43_150142 [Carnobacterium divergens]